MENAGEYMKDGASSAWSGLCVHLGHSILVILTPRANIFLLS